MSDTSSDYDYDTVIMIKYYFDYVTLCDLKKVRYLEGLVRSRDLLKAEMNLLLVANRKVKKIQSTEMLWCTTVGWKMERAPGKGTEANDL